MKSVPKSLKPAKAFLVAAIACYGVHFLGFFIAILAQPLLRGLYGLSVESGANSFFIPYITMAATITLAVFFALTALFVLRRIAEPDGRVKGALVLGAVFAGVSAVVMPIVNMAQNFLASMMFQRMSASQIGATAASMSAVSQLQSFFHVFSLLGTFALLIACAMLWQDQRMRENEA